PLTAGLPNRTVRRVMREALDAYADALPDPLPREMRDRLKLVSLPFAVAQMHYPSDRGALEAARKRLAFDELLPIQLTMPIRRRAALSHAAAALPRASGRARWRRQSRRRANAARGVGRRRGSPGNTRRAADGRDEGGGAAHHLRSARARRDRHRLRHARPDPG